MRRSVHHEARRASLAHVGLPIWYKTLGRIFGWRSRRAWIELGSSLQKKRVPMIVKEGFGSDRSRRKVVGWEF